MTIYLESVQAIQNYYEEKFQHIYDIPTSYNNIPFKENVKEWIRLSVFFYDSRQITIAGTHPDVRITGEINFQVFTEPGQGEKRGLEIVDKLNSAFSRKQITGNIRTRTLQFNKIGTEPNKGKLYQINADFPFEIDYRE